MKYEAVFGPQELLESCLPPVICAVKNKNTGELFQYNKIEYALRDLVDYRGEANFSVAMRRIVEESPKPEPKRWTVEDQKAGRLPCVGVAVLDAEGCECRIVGVNYVGGSVAVQYCGSVLRRRAKSVSSGRYLPNRNARRKSHSIRRRFHRHFPPKERSIL